MKPKFKWIVFRWLLAMIAIIVITTQAKSLWTLGSVLVLLGTTMSYEQGWGE